jgi:hypothetical protein
MYDNLELIAQALIPGFVIIDLVLYARAYQTPLVETAR